MINRAFDSYRDNRYPSINEQDELNLVLKAQNGDVGALAELLELKQHIVEKMALEFAYSPLTNTELLELGKKTLIKSIRIFDPNRGMKFGSFAYWGMKQAFQNATDNAIALKANSKPLGFSVFGEALDAAISKNQFRGNKQIEQSVEENKQTEQLVEGNTQNEQPPKTEDSRQVYITKRLDWSTLNYGLTIPVNKIDTFIEHLSFVPQQGKMYPVTIIMDGKDFQVQMMDVKFTSPKRSRVVQVRYSSTSPIANALQIKFRPAYQQLAINHQNFAGIDTYVSLVKGKNLDCFSLEFSGENTILGQDDFPEKVVGVQGSSSLADIPPRLAHTRPSCIIFQGQEYALNSWKDFLIKIGKLVYSCEHGDLLKEIDPSAIVFTDRRCIGNDATGMIAPKLIADNLWIETNFNANQLVAFAKWMLWWCDIEESKVIVRYHSKSEPKQTVSTPQNRVPKSSSWDAVSKDQPQLTTFSTEDVLSKHVPSFTPEFAEQCSQILKGYFSHGIRKNSIIDRNKFTRKYEEVFGTPLCEDNSTHLWDACTSKGVTVEDKIFPLTQEASDLVSNMTEVIINNGARQVYYSSFYDENQQKFCETGIGSADVLAGILRVLYPTYNHCAQFFRIDCSVSAEDEVIRALNTGFSMTIKEIQEQLEGLPQGRIVQICRSSPRIVKNGEKYVLLDSIRFDENEVLLATSKIETYIQKREYALLREISLENSETLNVDVCQEALQRAMFQKYLSQKYDINRGIISAKGASLSVSQVLKAFCEEQSQFTLSEIENLAQELNGYSSNQGLAIAQKVAVQIDSEHFIQTQLLDFDIEAIDNALDELIPNDMLPLQSIQSFITLPAIPGYRWTPQLLASYCRLVSRTFSLMEATTSNVCNGIIIRKPVAYVSFYHASAIMAVRDNISLEYEAVEHYALKKGLLTRRRTSAVTTVLEEMTKLSGDT